MASGELRKPIAASWRRSELARVDPEIRVQPSLRTEANFDTALLHAGRPVLDELAARMQLDSADFVTSLIDRNGRVLRRWAAGNRTARTLDSMGFDVGSSVLEELVGTSAPGLVLETKQSVTVSGEEHFAAPFKVLTCYGHPIFQPATRRISGVAVLISLAADTNPLFAPLLARAAVDIEQRLFAGSRVSQRELLTAFQAVSHSQRAAVGFDSDLTVTNQAASDLLSTTDLALLRTLGTKAADDSSLALDLASGQLVDVHVTRVGGPRGGALLQVTPLKRQLISRPPRATASSTTPILIAGPPGSGRTTLAAEMSSIRPVHMLTAAEALVSGSGVWARRFAGLVRNGLGTICVDGADLLSPDLVDIVSSHATSGCGPQLIIVTGSVDSWSESTAALASSCGEQIVLAPLTDRLAELPQFVARLLRQSGADPSLHLTPGALRALSSQPWPGNLRELRAVIEHVVRHRTTGGITADDLPERYRGASPVRSLGRIAHVEHNAIVAALRESGGNKVLAAKTLGISRSTLYAKLRGFRIST